MYVYEAASDEADNEFTKRMAILALKSLVSSATNDPYEKQLSLIQNIENIELNMVGIHGSRNQDSI